MIIHRPHKGSYQEAMRNAREFISLGECLNTLIAEHNEEFGNIFALSLSDLYVIPYSDGDERIGWKDEFVICVKPSDAIENKEGYKKYFGALYYHPVQIFGFISTDYEKGVYT